MESKKDKRLPKQFGDFAENLITYYLGRYKDMRVALVDHIGADIIATKIDEEKKYAISVKGRNFPKTESKSLLFDLHNVEMLEDFASSFDMIPTIAFVFVDEMEQDVKIRIFILKLDTLKKLAKDKDIDFVSVSESERSGKGYIFKYTVNKYLEKIKERLDIDYTELTFSSLCDNFNI